MSNNLLIYGPPASGKSTIVKKLAQIFNLRSIDLDQEIESRTGDTISQIIDAIGESGFRKVEADIFQDVILSNENAIIALGEGTLLDSESRKLAEAENTVVCLEPDQADLDRNFSNDAKCMSLCSGNKEKYKQLLIERRSHYLSFENRIASAFIDCNIDEENGLSSILIGKMLQKGIATFINTLFSKSKVYVIYDKNVKCYANSICKDLTNCVGSTKIVASEHNKNMKTVEKMLQKINDANIARNDMLVSIGGGITSDIVGFTASIWKRGVRWLNIPTTLLSMIDASVGGKTGVNFNGAKNMLGAFHKPAIVFIDDNFLDTLDHEQFIQGYAEAYKHFLIDSNVCRDNADVVKLLKSIENKDKTVSRCRTISRFLNVKLKIVQKDPFDKNGEREKLNLGHTVAHAIETITNNKISHGAAVAIGIVEELQLAKKRKILSDDNLLTTVANDLKALGLPTSIPKKYSFDDLLNLMKKDKKNSNGYIKFVILESMHQTKEIFLHW